ncbi:hypothetical protein C8Q73DRAFT_88088 [Cubamyces lactineus]|nr:hypothetical protein C8Q73DRAFT_88088 [Cubamyces lactineus]
MVLHSNTLRYKVDPAPRRSMFILQCDTMNEDRAGRRRAARTAYFQATGDSTHTLRVAPYTPQTARYLSVLPQRTREARGQSPRTPQGPVPARRC